MTVGDSAICKGCWQQMHVPIPLRGVLSAPFRLFGIKPSRMNPDTCTICEMMFSRMMRANKISVDGTVLFADLRDYTGQSDRLPADTMAVLIGAFYDESAQAIWGHEGVVIKTIGDAVMALFNFPLQQSDHARQAVLAAREIQRRCAARRDTLAAGLGLDGNALGVGVGIDTGTFTIGEFGTSHKDLTAIGSVVNRAARAQGAAAAGEILVTEAVCAAAGDEMAGAAPRDFQLKGFDAAVPLYAA